MANEIGRASNDFVSRKAALFFFGVYLFAGLIADVTYLYWFGFSRPFHLVIYTAMFGLSLWWFVQTRREGMTRGGWNVRMMVLLLLVFASTFFRNLR